MSSQESLKPAPLISGDEGQMPTGFEGPKVPRYCYDASLLRRCMDMLQVDQSGLARDDPLLFRELQGVCALCPNKEECAQDFAHQFDDVRWDKWWVYCPNSAMLTMIGASAKLWPRGLKMPPSATLSPLR